MANVQALKDRALLLKELRGFFDSKGFWEVQPPCLSPYAIIDPYIDPLEVGALGAGKSKNETASLYLQTSPELYMKRLLAADAPSIYAVVPAFRADEYGDLHRMEFTMLEWYQVGATEKECIELLGELACQILGSSSCDVLNYRTAFKKTFNLDPLHAPLADLVNLASEKDPDLADSMSDDRDGLLDYLMSEYVQPDLGCENPVVLRNYPLSQAALAKVSSDDDECAARFELYFRGVELANGYDELRDEKLLIQRLEEVRIKRRNQGRKSITPMPDSLARMISQGIPQCSGVALGVDRLHLVRSNKKKLDEIAVFNEPDIRSGERK
ncbi:MAG: EF-P lysine aminoacylase GenX [Rubripirellula sp.]|nr:EF-P lysine aminoacylase GenX [Rubripirellula sp.]